MKLETYNHEKELHKHKRRSMRNNFLIFLVFLFVVASIVIGFSPKETSFTGFSIFEQKGNATTPINASLSIPELTIKNNFEELRITVNEKSSIKIDDKTFSLTQTEREMILKDFEGTINFDENAINKLEGKASEIILSGIPISSEKKKLELKLDEQTSYKKIFITNDFIIKSLDYIASGKVQINQDLIKTNSEHIFLNNYLGNLKAENNVLTLEGKIESVEIKGENRNIKISQ